MTDERANMLRDELDNPPIYNIQKQEIDVEAMINNAPKSKWLIEFEALCKARVKERNIKRWQFWRKA